MAINPVTQRLLDSLAAQTKTGMSTLSNLNATPLTNTAAAISNPYASTGGGAPIDQSVIDSISPHSAQNDPSFLNRALDIVSRPGYAIRNVIKNEADPHGNKNIIEDIWRGLSGQDKTMTRDIRQAASQRNPLVNNSGSLLGGNGFTQGVGDFIGDVITDPLTYSTFGVGKAASVGLKGGALVEGKNAVTRAALDAVPALGKERAGLTSLLSGAKKYGAATKAGAGITPEATTAEELNAEVAKRIAALQQSPIAAAAAPAAAATAPRIGGRTALWNQLQSQIGKPHPLTPSQVSTVAGSVNDARRATVGAQAVDDVAKNAVVIQPASAPVPPGTRAIDNGDGTVTWVSAYGNKGVDPADALPKLITAPRTPAEPIVRDAAAQGNTARQLTTAAINDAKTNGYTGQQLGDYLTARVLPALDTAKEAAIAKGIYPVVKLGDNVYHIDVADVFNSLGPRVDEHYFNSANSGFNKLSASAITRGAAKAIELKQAGIYGDEALAKLRIAIEPGKTGVGSPRATRLATDLWNNVDDLERRMIDNEYKFGKRDVATGQLIGDNVAKETIQKLQDPNVGVAENLQDVANVNGNVKAAAKDSGVSVGGTIIGAQRAAQQLANVVPEADVAAARATLANSRIISQGKMAPAQITTAIGKRTMAQMRADAKAFLDANPGVSLDNVTEAVVGNGIQRFYQAIQSRFVAGVRQGDIFAKYRNWNGPAEILQHVYTKQLSDLNKLYSKDTFQAAFLHLMSPGKVGQAVDPEVLKAIDGMKPLLDHIVSTATGVNQGRDIIAESALFRNGLDIKTINMLLKEHGIPHQFTEDKSMADTALQIRKWDIKDPLDFLSKYQAASVSAAVRKTLMDDFTRNFASDVPLPGYIKIKPSDAKMSRFTDPTKYYPNEQVHMLSLFNKTFDLPTSFRGGHSAAAWMSNHLIDPYLRLWKPSVTIVRPGHHIRNVIGDFMLNGMAGVWSPKHYLRAANIQRALGQFNGDIKELTKLMGDKLPDGGSTAFSVLLKNGHREPFSYSQAGQLAFQHGIMTSYKAAEDILEKTTQGVVAKGTDKIMESLPMRIAGKISETENHHFKLAQWSSMMGDSKFTSKFNSVEDASMAATTIVQKFHPDTRGLAPFEAKVMRRVMPFYTWFRQAMPMIFNTMLVKPGRVTIVPKAYFATQQAMGINPNSLEDPFDPNKMYPSFIQEHLTGPLQLLNGPHFTMNTGTPIEGLGDIVNGNIPTNIVSMVNPLIKAPIELTQGSELISGKHIADKGEYIDQMLPFINQIANLSGVNVSGSVGATLSGNPAKTNIQVGPLKIDPQRAVQKGEKSFFANQSTLNFLAGLGIQNIDRPSYQRITARETKG